MRHQAGDRIVGLDLGSAYVRAVVAEVDQRRSTNVLGVGQAKSSGILEGTVIDIAEASRCVSAALCEAQDTAGYKIRQVEVGLSGRHFASLNTRGTVPITRTSRQISQDDLSRARDQAKIIVLPPEREITHCIPRMYRVDGQDRIRSPLGMYASRLEMEAHIVTGAGTQILNVFKTVEEAGYSVRSAALSAIAAAEPMLFGDEKLNGAVSVNIGAGVTELAALRENGNVYSAVIPRGGGHMTSDISSAFGISWAEAEQIKVQYGHCCPQTVGDVWPKIMVAGHDGAKAVSASELEALVRARAEEMVDFIRQELVKSGYYGLLPAGLVLSGGGALLPGVVDLCAAKLKMPVRSGVSKLALLAPPGSSLDMYSTALGLAQYALTSPEKPFTFRDRTRRFSIASLQRLAQRLYALFD